MLDFLQPLRGLTLLSVMLRMTLALVCGGLIGLEREYKRRPAGFRTHILICLGAAVTTLTSQYLLLTLRAYTDVARLGAQVIAGVGFIGAGTIIVTRSKRVKGLTTAAGLWTSAIVGLALGAGFFEEGVLVTGLILMAEYIFSRWEYRAISQSRETVLYAEYTQDRALAELLAQLHVAGIQVTNLDVSREGGGSHAILSVLLNGKAGEEVIAGLMELPDVTMVEEL